MTQLNLNFETGLTDQFPKFGECITASVYGCDKPLKNIAADLDMAPPTLSRMLNEADAAISFPLHRLAELIEVTGDLRPIYWLVETFCQDADAQREQAIDSLVKIMPRVAQLLERIQPAE